jgi:dTMP kinase
VSSVHPYPGKLVVLEGLDGVGKSTQVNGIAAFLAQQHVPYRIVDNPGSTEFGQILRSLLLQRAWVPTLDTETLAFCAAHAHVMHSVVQPAMQRGELVLLNRYVMSTFAYQGFGRYAGDPKDLQWLRIVLEGSSSLIAPDATYYLDLGDVVRSLGRERDRIEREGSVFYSRVRKGFEAVLADPANFGCRPATRIDARGAPEDVTSRIVADLQATVLASQAGSDRQQII